MIEERALQMQKGKAKAILILENWVEKETELVQSCTDSARLGRNWEENKICPQVPPNSPSIWPLEDPQLAKWNPVRLDRLSDDIIYIKAIMTTWIHLPGAQTF